MGKYILFCESPFEKNKVDEEYADQFDAAKKCGFHSLLLNFEDLVSRDQMHLATKKIFAAESTTDLIYRGWMLTPNQYSYLYEELLNKNYKLINDPYQYQNCHYLPDSLRFISDFTPLTVYQKINTENDIEILIKKAKVFENKAVIIKDYVKSEKHDWDTACYINNASDYNKLKSSIGNLIDLRGKHFNEGVVVREFVELNDLAIHSKSGMPLTEEYRLFFFKHELKGLYDYWEEGTYAAEKPEVSKFVDMAKTINSNFFSMDIARQKNGELIIVELGDGQVAGLPERTNRFDFYNAF